MDLVVDASVAFKWLVTEDGSEAAYRLLERHDLIAPDVLLIECRNAALTHVRRGLLTAEEAKQTENALGAMPLQTLPSSPFLTNAFEIGLDINHPIYDCIYLATAIETNRTLITADAKFAAKSAAWSRSNRVTLLEHFAA